MKEPIIEGAEGWTVPLDGYSIERISIDSGFVILLLDHEPEGFELRIGVTSWCATRATCSAFLPQ